MKNSRLFILLLFLLILVGPKPVWPAGDAAKPEEGKPAAAEAAPGTCNEAGSRGEGSQSDGTCPKGAEAPCTFGPIVTDTAVPIGKGKFAVQPTFSYSFKTDTFGNHWGRGPTGGDFRTFSMDWKLTYGPTENMEVFVDIPYVHNWASGVRAPGSEASASADSGGLGDVNLTLKYRLVEEKGNLPTITALFATGFPTGKFKDLDPRSLDTDAVGGGSYVFTTGFNVSKYIEPFIVYANLWYSMPTSFKDDEGHQYPGDFVTVNLAAEYPIVGKWVALMEMTSTWGGGRLFGPDTNVPHSALVSVVPAIEYMATEKFSMALGLNVDVIGKNSDATIGPLFSMIYAF